MPRTSKTRRQTCLAPTQSRADKPRRQTAPGRHASPRQTAQQPESRFIPPGHAAASHRQNQTIAPDKHFAQNPRLLFQIRHRRLRNAVRNRTLKTPGNHPASLIQKHDRILQSLPPPGKNLCAGFNAANSQPVLANFQFRALAEKCCAATHYLLITVQPLRIFPGCNLLKSLIAIFTHIRLLR